MSASNLTRPIAGIENRTAQEVFDIMCGRILSAIEVSGARSCTCHPDDNPPVPCAGKYALSDCQAPSPRAQALDEVCKLVERRINMVPSDTKAFRAYQDACRHILVDIRALSSQPSKRERLLQLAEISGDKTLGDLSSQPVADGWLPIETAPKDGTHFIGWDGKWAFRCSAGKKYVLYPHMDGGPTYRDVWDGHYYDSLTIERPTHWRPLPASPGASE